MSDEAWHQRKLHLRSIWQQTGRARVDPPGHPKALHDWLEHQKALGALGAYPLLLLQAYIKTTGASSRTLPWLGRTHGYYINTEHARKMNAALLKDLKDACGAAGLDERSHGMEAL